jgi:2-polyprenyl-3-methyl-5-hydroxy-6-metoxy-1,4-benzoquinol methylase
MDATQTVLLDRPHAIRIGEFILRETAYGVVKRLRYFVGHIEAERKRLGLGRGEIRILDIGCGTGTYVSIPLALMGYNVVGMDTDAASIERARLNAEAAGTARVDLRLTRLEELCVPLPFNVAICSEVLEHQEHPETMLQGIRSVLTSDGLALFTVPNGYGYFELESRVVRRFPGLLTGADQLERRLIRRWGSAALIERHLEEYGGQDPDRDRRRRLMEQSSLSADQKHFQEFTPSSIRRLIGSQGLTILSFRNNTVWAGNALNALIRSLDQVLFLNARFADFLPEWLASDWMIAARKT